MRFCRQSQLGEPHWRVESERRMHAGRLHGGERTLAATAATERPTARLGIAFSEECGRAPRD